MPEKPVYIKSSSIKLDGHRVPYLLKRSGVARHARLEMLPDTGLAVIIPARFPAAEVETIIYDKQQWVLRKLRQFERAREAYSNNSDCIRYLGHKIKIKRKEAFETRAAIEGNRLVVSSCEGGYAAAVESWCRTQAQELIEGLVETHSRCLGVKCRAVRLTSARTRWASCSVGGCLRFNWRLISARPAAIEYVVIHELCHLKELNHSPAFWKLVESACPDWRKQRKWLRDNEALLTHPLPRA